MIQHKKYLVSVILLVIVVFFAYKYFSSQNSPAFQDIKVVETKKAIFGNVKRIVNLIGTIKARNSSMMLAQESGALNIIVNAGEKVTKSTLIAKIVNPQAERRYVLATKAEAIAKMQLDRSERLLKSGAYSKKDFEANKSAWIAASKDLADAKAALEKFQLIAPFDGIVGVYKFQNGAQLKFGDEVVSFYDPSKIRIEFDVPESEVKYVNDGQELFILGKEYQLTHIQKMLDADKYMSPAYVDIDCADCLIGSSADVSLVLEKKTKVIVIPFEAILLLNGQVCVYVVEDGRAHVRNVDLGIREKNMVEITNGLEIDEEFIAKNPTRLYPEVAVKTIK